MAVCDNAWVCNKELIWDKMPVCDEWSVCDEGPVAVRDKLLVYDEGHVWEDDPLGNGGLAHDMVSLHKSGQEHIEKLFCDDESPPCDEGKERSRQKRVRREGPQTKS